MPIIDHHATPYLHVSATFCNDMRCLCRRELISYKNIRDCCKIRFFVAVRTMHHFAPFCTILSEDSLLQELNQETSDASERLEDSDRFGFG